jgi:NAD-dependent DNA ligase
MGRDYILKDSATTRKAVLDAVLSSCIAFSTDSSEKSVSISIGYDEEKLAKYQTLIEKLTSEVPLSEIPELQYWQQEMEQQAEACNQSSKGYFAARTYRKRLLAMADSILLSENCPSLESLQTLASKAVETELFCEGTGTLSDVRDLCKVFTPLNDSVAFLIGHLVHYESAALAHKSFFADSMWRAWKMHRNKKGKSNSRNEPARFEYDQPPEVFFSGMRFLFTGKFAYGSRKKCASEVTARGGEVVENPSRWIDFLVVASGEENASPSSSKASYCLHSRAIGWPCLVITEELWAESLANPQSSPGV